IWGSRPDPLASSASGATWAGLTPSRAAAVARRSLMEAIRSLFSGPRLEAPLDVGSYPVPAAEGRLWKYFGSASRTGLSLASLVGWLFFRTGRVNPCPMRWEPTVLPPRTTREPLALLPKATCAKPVMALSLIHISEPTRQAEISYAVF